MRKKLKFRTYTCLAIYTIAIAWINICYVATYDTPAIRSVRRRGFGNYGICSAAGTGRLGPLVGSKPFMSAAWERVDNASVATNSSNVAPAPYRFILY